MMMIRQMPRFLAAATMLAFANSATVQAADLFYSDTTTGGPTFNRPVENGTSPPYALSIAGTAVPYHSQPFYVTETTTFSFLSAATGAWDNYLFLYQTAFLPGSSLTNVIIGNDDFPSGGLSGFNNVPLTALTQYYLVTTGYDNTNFGAFQNKISGGVGATPIVLGVVPEPSSMVLTAISVAGLVGWSARKRVRKPV